EDTERKTHRKEKENCQREVQARGHSFWRFSVLSSLCVLCASVVRLKGASMSVRVHIPTPMRQHTQGQAVVEVKGTTVQASLHDLSQKFPAITDRLFENGQVRRFVNVYLNDEDIR